MKHLSSPPFHEFALYGLLVFASGTASVYAHEPIVQETNPCVAVCTSHSSTSAAGSNGSHASAAEARSNAGEHGSTSSCVGTRCTSSSSVVSGQKGLSGSSTLPDGSSVTVHSHNGVVSSSTVTTGSSGHAHGSSASAGTNRGKDCVVTTTPHQHKPTPDQQNRKTEK